jgi:hypothetical protein
VQLQNVVVAICPDLTHTLIADTLFAEAGLALVSWPKESVFPFDGVGVHSVQQNPSGAPIVSPPVLKAYNCPTGNRSGLAVCGIKVTAVGPPNFRRPRMKSVQTYSVEDPQFGTYASAEINARRSVESTKDFC